jgi:glycosyltransferase involved in cell wall biosynthesis
MNRPRIGIDLHTLEGLHQGSRTHCLELFSRVILQLPEVDFFLFVDTDRWGSENATSFQFPNGQVVHMPHAGPAKRLCIHLPRLAKQHRIDLLHTQYICPPLSPCMTAVTIHDILFEEFPQYFEMSMRLRSQILFRLSAYKSKLVLTVSEFSLRDLAKQYKVPLSKLTTIYNGANASKFFPGFEGAEEVAKLGIEPGKYVLTVGRLEPRKNHVGLLRAYAALPKPRPRLVITGQRDFGFEQIYAVVAELKLADDVLFLESVEDSMLGALYRHAKVFVYPSFAEGFGMPVVEAMASGVPVVTSATTSLSEIAGDAALTVDPYNISTITDALVRVLDNEPLAHELSDKGIERAKLFSWDVSAARLAARYRSIFSIPAV